MNGLLLRCYDKRYDHIGAISWNSAWQFSKAANLGFAEVRKDSLGPEPYMEKIQAISDHIHDVDFIVYSDVDVLFNPGLTCHDNIELPRELFTHPLCLSTDSCGICCGFMVLQKTPELLKLLDVWLKLGYMIVKGKGDQATLKLLLSNFKWVQDLVGLIPQTIVSNPEKKFGWLAHHFWANGGERWWGAMRTAEATAWPELPSIA
jgi:hypothetical protein